LKSLRVLHLCTKDQGGAAIAGIRLHKGLLLNGVDSHFLFQEVKTAEVPESSFLPQLPKSLKRQILNKFGLGRDVLQKNKARVSTLPRNYDMFSFADSDVDITALPKYQQADVINLHWVPRFLDYPSFFRKCTKPVVWTLHDMNPFSGGFHYQRDVEKNQGKIMELDREIFQVKEEAYRHCRSLSVVAPSRWMYQEAKSSPLMGRFPVYHIPYGIDTTIFRPYDQAVARQVFNLPPDRKLLLFVSDSLKNERKGFDLLLEALGSLEGKNLWLCAVGSAKAASSQLKQMSSLGRISDERLMALLYSACDAFVLPSREDNFPNVLLEATACGTPVIAFPIGGVPDIIEDGKNGVIAGEVSAAALQSALKRFLSEPLAMSSPQISENTRKKYALQEQATQYQALYHQMLEKNSE
jgi:glycosyltransferase involved in cell wall biosynthesis